MNGDFVQFQNTISEEFEAIMLDSKPSLQHRLTPFIITFCKLTFICKKIVRQPHLTVLGNAQNGRLDYDDVLYPNIIHTVASFVFQTISKIVGETNVTTIDMQTLIEAGLTICRFKMWSISEDDIVTLVLMLQEAISLICEKYKVRIWPIALCVDIPNACIRTGYLEKLRGESKPEKVLIDDNSIIMVTCKNKYRKKCNSKRIYIDDPYTFPAIHVGTEMSVAFGKIVMVCVEVLDKETIKCKVIRGDWLEDEQVFCIRGVRHTKPPLSKSDLDLIEFAKENKIDIIIINSLRRPKVLVKIKEMIKDASRPPLVFASICEQEGLDNIEEIIKVADGIVLAREFLAYEIENISKMITIELNVCAKCRQAGKPILLSGNILESTLEGGYLTDRDAGDVTNAIMHGAGFLIRGNTVGTTKNVINAMNIINSICRTVETVHLESDFWRLKEKYKMPVNAAEACVLSCALTVKVTNSTVCIVLSVSGSTAKELSFMMPGTIILTVVTDQAIGRQLRVYRGIVPVVYSEKPEKSWVQEMNSRVLYAAEFGLKYDILKYGDTYVALKRAKPYSLFCDHISIWQITQQRKVLVCPE